MSKEIEQICKEVNSYYKIQLANIRELENKIKDIKAESNDIIDLMISVKSKGYKVNEKVLRNILRDSNFKTRKK